MQTHGGQRKIRVGVAGIFHETNTFVLDKTELSDFSVAAGADIMARRGDGSQVDGFLEGAETAGWEVAPLVVMEAMPSGPVNHNVFEYFWRQLIDHIAEHPLDQLDAMFLSFHGAMVTTELNDVEGEIIERLRRLPGGRQLPIFGVFDLHATFSDAMSRANCLICYRNNPHTDAFECGARAASLLEKAIINKAQPSMVVLRAPIIWPPGGTATAVDPMRALELEARKLEDEYPCILAANVIGGFSYSDVAEAGVAFVISFQQGCERIADHACSKLAEMAWRLREQGLVTYKPIRKLLKEILPVHNGPIIIAEPADNIGAGAPGDATDILKALIEFDVPKCAAIMADARAVRALARTAIGQTTRITLGGRGSNLCAGPINLDVRLLARSDGRFTLADPNSHLAAIGGRDIRMGPSVLVSHRGLTLMINSKKTPPWDLGQWTSLGVDPRSFDLIVVKAAVAHRQAYDQIAAENYVADSLGACSADLKQMPYRNLRRPIFPIEDIE